MLRSAGTEGGSRVAAPSCCRGGGGAATSGVASLKRQLIWGPAKPLGFSSLPLKLTLLLGGHRDFMSTGGGGMKGQSRTVIPAGTMDKIKGSTNAPTFLDQPAEGVLHPSWRGRTLLGDRRGCRVCSSARKIHQHATAATGTHVLPDPVALGT